MAPKAWYLVPGASEIQEISLDKPIIQYLHCRNFDAQCFRIDTHTQYALYYDDDGVYADAPYNRLADDMLSRIDILWGTYNGWFLVVKNVYDDDGHETKADMDVTKEDLIKLCNRAIHGA